MFVVLIQDLLRKTNKNHPDYEDLETAVQEVERVATYVNEQIRQFQNEQKLLEIYTRGGVFDVHFPFSLAFPFSHFSFFSFFPRS
jgi:hypothetical protein